MNVVRVAVLRGEEGGLPMTTQRPKEGEGEVGDTVPPYDGYVQWWAPRVVEDGPLFPIGMIRAVGGMMVRYPHDGDQTEDYMSDQAESSTSSGEEESP